MMEEGVEKALFAGTWHAFALHFYASAACVGCDPPIGALHAACQAVVLYAS